MFFDQFVRFLLNSMKTELYVVAVNQDWFHSLLEQLGQVIVQASLFVLFSIEIEVLIEGLMKGY